VPSCSLAASDYLLEHEKAAPAVVGEHRYPLGETLLAPWGLRACRAARTSPYTVRTDNTPKVFFSATLGEEPEVELALGLLVYFLLCSADQREAQVRPEWAMIADAGEPSTPTP
jgi:hypothetical protein